MTSATGNLPPVLLSVGHVTLDRYGERLLPGGCVTYASLVFAALGGRARLLSRAAKDFPRDFFPAGVEAALAESPKTTVFENSYDPHGFRRQTVDALAGPLSPEILPDGWIGPDVLFLGPVIGELDPEAWIKAAGARQVAAGVQGFVRQLEGRRVVSRRLDTRAAWLRRIDAAFLSDDDCLSQPDLALELAGVVPLVVLTHQRRGCTVYRDKRAFSIGIHATQQIDPTGAGDTFAAGVLFALCHGKSTEEAARLGAACASIVIEGLATEAVSRLSEEAFLRFEKIK